MPRIRLLAAAGIAAFLIALLATLPARVAYHWLAPAELRLSGLSGSIWSGSAVQGTAAGIYFRDLEWRFRPASLLAGKIASIVSARPTGGMLQTYVATGLFGDNLLLRDLDATLPLDVFSGIVPLEGVSGDLALRFDRIRMEDGIPTEATGILRITNLVLRPLHRRALGDYRAVFETGDEGIVGTVEDTSGVLDLEGNAVLRPDRSYSLTGRVAAEPEAPSALVQQLQFLGSADARGRREFRFEGSL